MTTVSGVTNSNTAVSTTSSSASSNIGLTSNQFLSLLTTQLQSQDPLNPTDPNQFTSEMVQYASLSEQIDTNSKLDSLNTSMSSVLTQVSLLASAGGATATA
jgi:flagellar basal-body rod modification protein FlgD